MDKRPTIADLLSMKGKRQLTMLRVETLEEAEAADKAGIDMLSIPFEILGPQFREACPTCFAMAGKAPGTFITAEDYIRAGWTALTSGRDAMRYGMSRPSVVLPITPYPSGALRERRPLMKAITSPYVDV